MRSASPCWRRSPTPRTEDAIAEPAAIPPSRRSALVEGFQAAFIGGAGFAVLGLILTLVLIRSKDSRAHVELSAKGEAPVAA